METHKLNFIFPDDKYVDWLCSELEWEVTNPKAEEETDPIIEENIIFTPLHTLPSNEYIPVACGSGYGYRAEGINPTGHINFTKLSNHCQVIVPTTVQTLRLSMTLVDPNDETIVKKVQLKQVLKNE